MNIVKKAIIVETQRLLDEVYEITDRIADDSVLLVDSVSPVERANGVDFTKEELGKITRIQTRLAILSRISSFLFEEE